MLEHPKKQEYRIGKNLLIWDNQQERLARVPEFSEEMKWFIAGFVDGEGSFCLNIKRRQRMKYGFTVDPAFYVYQHGRSRWILEVIRHYFNRGSIHRKSSPNNVLTFQIAGIRPCYESVLPFFKHYQLATKAETFLLFAKAIELMYRKEHLAKDGKIELVEIAYRLNQMGKGKKWEKDELIGRILRG